MFDLASIGQRVLERRYRVDESLVDEFRRSTDALRELTPRPGLYVRHESLWCLSMSYFGTVLTWYGDLDGAREVHEQALASARRQGSVGAIGRVLVDLAVTAMRAGDIDAVQALAAEGRAAAAAGGLEYYVAAATALQAWSAWRTGRADEALSLGTNALALWDAQPVLYPFHCLALWPLIGTYLDAGETANAIRAAKRLLEPPQLRMPDELEAALQVACQTFESAGARTGGGFARRSY